MPRSAQIFIFGGRGGGGVSRPTQIQSAKIYQNFHWGGYSRPTQIQSAKICPNFPFWRGATPDQLKSKVPRSVQIFIGGGVLETNISEILQRGHSRNFEPKILVTEMCSASQIVSHIMYVETNKYHH